MPWPGDGGRAPWPGDGGRGAAGGQPRCGVAGPGRGAARSPQRRRAKEPGMRGDPAQRGDPGTKVHRGDAGAPPSAKCGQPDQQSIVPSASSKSTWSAKSARLSLDVCRMGFAPRRCTEDAWRQWAPCMSSWMTAMGLRSASRHDDALRLLPFSFMSVAGDTASGSLAGGGAGCCSSDESILTARRSRDKARVVHGAADREYVVS